MQEKGFGSVLVICNDGNLCGIFTERDVLKKCTEKDFFNSPIKKFMTGNIQTVTANMPITDIHTKFSGAKFRHLPVVEGGKPVGMISMRDLFRHWGDLIEDQRVELEQKYNKTMGVVVHDLRSPIYAVRSINEILMTEKDYQSYIDNKFPDMIDESCVTMAQLIDDLLDFSQIKNGTYNLEKTSESIVELLEKVIQSFTPNADAKGIKIDFKSEGHIPEVLVDKRRLVQGFQNLISNSIKYSDRDSHVEVEVGHKDGNVTVAFVDHGQGIPEKELPKVFDELCKISSKPTEGEPSTGLGLSITKKLIEAHGGNIKVTSNQGKETRFELSLPSCPVVSEAAA